MLRIDRIKAKKLGFRLIGIIIILAVVVGLYGYNKPQVSYASTISLSLGQSTATPLTISSNTSSPTSNSGTWLNPTNAYADGGGYASVTSSTPSANQTYGTYGFGTIPADSTITGVRVRTDALSEERTATPAFITGAEAGIINAGSIATSRVWDMELSGPPAVVTSPVHAGVRAFKSTGLQYVKKNILTTRLVGSVAVRIEGTIPSGDMGFLESGGTYPGILAYWGSNQKLAWAIGGDPAVYSSSTVSANTWYVIDFDINTTSGIETIDWKIDGIAQPRASKAAASANLTFFEIGNFAINSAVVYHDDIVLSYTGADYPIGSVSVIGYSPNSDGTHKFTNGDFKYNNTTNVPPNATDVHTYLDEVPITSTTDYISTSTAATANYTEVGFADTGRTDNALGLAVVSSLNSTTDNGDDQVSLKFNDGGTVGAIFTNLDVSYASIGYDTRTFATAPSGGVWTAAKIDALKVRWGYAADISPVPSLQGLMVEAAWPNPGTNEQLRVAVSWDGGTSWSSKHTHTVTGTETTYWDNVTADTSWTLAKLSDANFQVNVDAYTVGYDGNVRLDWIPVEVTYTTIDSSLTNSPTTENIGYVKTSTVYYARGTAPSNPVVDGDCTFTVANDGPLTEQITISGTDFTGGTPATLTSSLPGANQVRVKFYASGDNVTNAPYLTSSDQTIVSSLNAGSTKKWDFSIEMGSSFADTNQKTSVFTLTASAP